jgi:beta-galactosidase
MERVLMNTRVNRIGGVVLGMLVVCWAGLAWGAEFTWLEGEQPESINVKADINGSGKPRLVSAGQWLTVHMEAGEVEKQMPADGVLMRYTFKADQQGSYSVWGRIGFEFARSPFDWRLDGKQWSRITPENVTTDLTELSFFTEVAWLKLGQEDLAAGEHAIEIRIPRPKNAKGETQRLLFGLDALCITSGTFFPNGKYKPGEEWRDARDLEAGKTLFQMPEAPRDGVQASVPLKGLWEVCRHDEDLPPRTSTCRGPGETGSPGPRDGSGAQ